MVMYLLVTDAAQGHEVLGLVALGNAPRDDVVDLDAMLRSADAAAWLDDEPPAHGLGVALHSMTSRNLLGFINACL